MRSGQMSEEQVYDINKEITIVGAGATGKSAFVQRALNNPTPFATSYKETISADFFVIEGLKVKDKNIRLQLWDTAGQERFRALTKSYYRNSDVILFVYDVNNKMSLQQLADFVQEVKKYVLEEDCLMYLVGAKADLPHEVTEAEVIEFAKQHKLTITNEVSAKTDAGINKLFEKIGNDIYQKEMELEKSSISYSPSANKSNQQPVSIHSFRPSFWQRNKNILIGLGVGLAVAIGIAVAALFLWKVLLATAIVGAAASAVAAIASSVFGVSLLPATASLLGGIGATTFIGLGLAGIAGKVANFIARASNKSPLNSAMYEESEEDDQAPALPIGSTAQVYDAAGVVVAGANHQNKEPSAVDTQAPVQASPSSEPHSQPGKQPLNEPVDLETPKASF